jgi:hypothetical protein
MPEEQGVAVVALSVSHRFGRSGRQAHGFVVASAGSVTCERLLRKDAV